MKQPPKPVSIEVDPDVAKRADEAYELEIEAEVARRIKGDSERMDPKTEAALAAAQTDAKNAAARADAAETAAKDSKARADALESRLKKQEDDAKARADSEAQVLATQTLGRARVIASAKGFRGDAAETEAKRLAGLGSAAVDEIARSMPAPRADDMLLATVGAPRADQAPGPVSAHRGGDGRLTFTVTDHKLTTKGA